MEKKMTAEEIIDSKYPFPAGKLKDVTLNGVQVKELMESLVKLSPLPDNNGVKEPDGYVGLDGEVNPFYKKPNKKLLDLLKKIFKDKLQPVYFSPPKESEPINLHNKGLVILNSIWEKVNERLKELDLPELMLSVKDEHEILSKVDLAPKESEGKELSDDKWISVEERLPETDDSIPCLVWDNYHKEISVKPYNKFHHCWDQEDGDDYYTEAIGGKITYWQPLPIRPTT